MFSGFVVVAEMPLGDGQIESDVRHAFGHIGEAPFAAKRDLTGRFTFAYNCRTIPICIERQLCLYTMINDYFASLASFCCVLGAGVLVVEPSSSPASALKRRSSSS